MKKHFVIYNVSDGSYMYKFNSWNQFDSNPADLPKLFDSEWEAHTELGEFLKWATENDFHRTWNMRMIEIRPVYILY